MVDNRSAAFFDVDGTLSATRSTTSLIWLRARQHSPWRHRFWLANLVWGAPLTFFADKLSRDLADRLVFSQFAGLSLSRLAAEAEACCRAVLLPVCFADALAEIAMHKAAGRTVVLVSGGVAPVLQPLADILGADLIARGLEAEGDRLTGRCGLFPLLDDASKSWGQAAAKALAVQRYADSTGTDLTASYGYGDSINDLDMLRLVGHPTAINPDRALGRMAKSQDWRVRRWRS